MNGKKKKMGKAFAENELRMESDSLCSKVYQDHEQGRARIGVPSTADITTRNNSVSVATVKLSNTKSAAVRINIPYL